MLAVDAVQLGSYTVTYTVTDSVNLSTTVNRTVIYRDTTPPVLTSSVPLRAWMLLELGEEWPSIVVDDLYDGNLTANLTSSVLVVAGGSRTAVAATVFPDRGSVCRLATLDPAPANIVPAHSGHVRLGNGNTTREFPSWTDGISGLASTGTMWNVSYSVLDSNGNQAMLNLTIQVCV